jgi:hypothetical protein
VFEFEARVVLMKMRGFKFFKQILQGHFVHQLQVKSATDVTNFDSYSADESGVPPDDLSGWDKDF